MSSSSHIHAVSSNPDAASFHDRDRNELRSILARATTAIDTLIDVGSSIRELHVIAESGDDSITMHLPALNALQAAFAALDDVRSIARIARDVLADHEVAS
jgi:hypothetical protein